MVYIGNTLLEVVSRKGVVNQAVTFSRSKSGKQWQVSVGIRQS